MTYRIVFKIVIIITLFLVQSIFCQHQTGPNVISNGGKLSESVNYSLNMTIGETFSHDLNNNSNQNYSGFWNLLNYYIATDISENTQIPLSFILEQNYPNPFNPTTSIKFCIPEKSKVVLKIFDILGRLVSNMINEELDAGLYTKEFNAAMFSSGVYLYRIEAGKNSSIKKMLFIK